MFKVKSYGICLYKIKNKKVKVLLCRSITSVDKWGFLKGSTLKCESAKRTAQREFFEESSIFIHTSLFEKYFEQENVGKDVGIWAVNYKDVANINDFFYDDILGDNYICDENSEVRFFDIDKLPRIKSKQQDIVEDIKKYLQKK